MLKTLLLDLDNTLLGNDTDVFLPAYLGKLRNHFHQTMDGDAVIAGILVGTRAMVGNTNPGVLLEEAFHTAYEAYSQTDLRAARTVIDDFYASVYPQLAEVTTVRPAAVKLIEFAAEHGLEVVIATNPLFPETAILQRLAWSGIDPDAAPIRMITNFETMHFSKPHPEYYAEMLGLLGRRSSEVIMVGDDWENDIIGADQMRIPTWWIADTAAEPPSADIKLTGQGDLDAFYTWLQANIGLSITTDIPRRTPEIVARLRATVANVMTLIGNTPAAQFLQQPTGCEDSIVDNIQHLCQMDQEALLPALGLQTYKDAGCQPEDMVAHFVKNRALLCDTLAQLAPADWQRTITSPNGSQSTIESLAAFVAHHDKGHVQQIKRLVG